MQAVGYPVLQFLQQHVLLPQQLVLFLLQDAPLGDVLDAEQNGRVGASLVVHLPCVQAHRAMSEAGKRVLDLVAFHHALLGQDFFQQQPELWNVPLPVAQRIERSALGVLGADLEYRIEGAVCGDHAQFLVEDENRLADRVHDALSERQRVRDGGELFPKAGRLHKRSPIFPHSEMTPLGAALQTLRPRQGEDCAKLLTITEMLWTAAGLAAANLGSA